MHKPESVLKKEMNKSFWDFQLQKDHPFLARRADLLLVNKNERTCYLMDFTVPVDLRIKESKNIDEYLGLGRKLKQLWNMKVTVI